MKNSLRQEIQQQLVTIEKKLWKNDALLYKNSLREEAMLVFAETGVISRDVAVDAILKENTEGRKWAEVHFNEIRSIDLGENVALLNYKVEARWEHEKSSYKALASSVYVQQSDEWKLIFHQQTSLQ